MLRKEDAVMVEGMARVQKMVSFKMNIKPDPDVLRKLNEQANKIKYDPQNKGLSEEQINIKIKESGVKDKQAAEKAKLDVYAKDANEFKKMADEFLNHLPADPAQAAQLIHYCSLRLFSECNTLDDTLPYNSKSYNQQRCALFEDALKEHVSNHIKNAEKPEKNTKYWVEILEKASEYKNSTMISAVNNGIQNCGKDILSKVFKKSDKLKEKYDSILDAQHPLSDGTTKSLKDIMGNVNYSDKFQPTPPPLTYFGGYVATYLGGKFDTQKQIVRGGKEALEVINSQILSEKNMTDLVEVLRNHEKDASNMTLNSFIKMHCKDIVSDVSKNQKGLSNAKIEASIEKCLVAIKAVSLQRESQKNIADKGGSIACLKKSIDAKEKELADLENKKQNLEASVTTYRDSSNKAAAKLFPDAGSSLNYFHRICTIPDTEARNTKLNNFISDYKNISDDIKNSVNQIIHATQTTANSRSQSVNATPQPVSTSSAIHGRLQIGSARTNASSSNSESASSSRKSSTSSSEEPVEKRKNISFTSSQTRTRLFDATASLNEDNKRFSSNSLSTSSEESEKEQKKSENLVENDEAKSRKRRDAKGSTALDTNRVEPKKGR